MFTNPKFVGANGAGIPNWYIQNAIYQSDSDGVIYSIQNGSQFISPQDLEVNSK